MKLRMTLLACMICVASPAWADEQVPRNWSTRDTDRLGWAAPDYAKVQTGGYAGLINVGLGYAAFSDVINVGIDYGYVPSTEAGREVHCATASLAIRPLDFRIGRVRLVPAYLWGGWLYTNGDGYFVSPGERYPPGYYRPTALHPLYGLGVELDWLPSSSSAFERLGVYWEARVFGPYFMTYLENRQQLDLDDVVVSTLGYRAAW